MTKTREKELIEYAEYAFKKGYTESQVVALIKAQPDVAGDEDIAIAIVNQAD